MSLRVTIMTDRPGWHGARLREALAARGACGEYVALSDCCLDMSDTVPRIRIPGFDDGLPDAVFVRGVAGGTLEEVVFRLNVLHALKAAGVPVYNDGRAIERSVDKALTSFLLSLDGLPTPQTWICSDRAQAEAIVRAQLQQGHVLVCKPLFGSQGKGVCLLRQIEDLPDREAVQGVWYLQRFIGSDKGRACDWRVLVVGGQAVAAMRRSADGWLTNVAQGGACHPAELETELCWLAERATHRLEMNYAGVDLMRDAEGQWWVLEVNSIPAWRGLQKVTSLNIAAALVDDLLAQCGPQRRLGVAS